MEKELGRGQARVETVDHEAFGRRNLAVPLEMGQSSILKSIRYSNESKIEKLKNKLTKN